MDNLRWVVEEEKERIQNGMVDSMKKIRRRDYHDIRTCTPNRRKEKEN